MIKLGLDMRLKDKVAIITGAAAGIGEASSRLFAAEGATVVALDLDSAGLDRLVGEIRDQGLACHGLRADVTSSSDCREAARWTARELGRIDILFNNAGFVHQGTLLEATEEDWDQALDLNVKSMFRTCRHALPVMLRQRSGNIINTASVAGLAGVVKRGVYSVSKAAVVGLTKSLAIDYVNHGIRANCICPGTVDTPSLQSRINTAADPVQARKDFIARQPLGRLCRAEEIAALALYLASDDSVFMTGQAVVIDGAMTL